MAGATPGRRARGLDSGVKKAAASESDGPALHAKLGHLPLENAFLEGALSKAGLWPSARR